LGWGLPVGGGWLALRALDFSAISEGAAPVVPCDISVISTAWKLIDKAG
jgi:hypothetical protein